MAARTRRSLEREAAFWDASALVPLCVRQDLTAQARNLYKDYRITIWWATPVEIASALARLSRMQQIDATELNVAWKLTESLSSVWWIVQPSESLKVRALSLVERYDLRAADALQLAAAVEWCEDQPQGRVFLSADKRLREAALLCGFDTRHL